MGGHPRRWSILAVLVLSLLVVVLDNTVLNVALRWKIGNGATNETVVGAVSAGTGWMPTQSFSLAQTLGLWDSSMTATVQIVLDPEDYGGAIAVDDVYIDPYTRG